LKRILQKIVNNALDRSHLKIYNTIIKNPKPFPNRAINIFDVGSYLGSFSKSIKNNLKIKKNVNFFLFDPNPNLNLNDFEYFCLGISDKTKKQKFYLNSFFPSSGSGFNTITKDDYFWNLSRKMVTFSPKKSLHEFDTDTTTLDEFCKLKKINFIEVLKIDTEGHELNGGKKNLKNTKIIQIEILDNKSKFQKKSKKINSLLKKNSLTK